MGLVLLIDHPAFFRVSWGYHVKTEKPPKCIWHKDLGLLYSARLDVSPYVV
jgi:hypothetical protein